MSSALSRCKASRVRNSQKQHRAAMAIPPDFDHVFHDVSWCFVAWLLEDLKRIPAGCSKTLRSYFFLWLLEVQTPLLKHLANETSLKHMDSRRKRPL